MQGLFGILFFVSLFGVITPFIKRMDRMHFGLVALFSLAVIGITAPPEDQTAQVAGPEVQAFQGFIVPGTAVDARKAGFTNCTSDYYWATCRKEDASLFNLKAPAVISMKLEGGKFPEDLTQLNYDSVAFVVPGFKITYPCKNYHDPLACVAPGALADFQKKLVGDGWKMREWRDYRYFYHPEYEIEISIAEAFRPGSHGLSIRHMPIKEVHGNLARIANEKAMREERTAAAAKFEREMAGNKQAD